MSPREDLTPWHATVRWLVTDASSQARLPIRVVLARVPAGFALGTSPGFATGSKLFPKNGPFRHTSRRSRLPVRRCFGSGSCWLRARHFSRLRKWLEAFSEKRPVPARFAPHATPGPPLFWLGFLLASRSALLPASQPARSFFRETARSGILRADRDSRFAVVLARVPAGFALGTSPGFANGSKPARASHKARIPKTCMIVMVCRG